MLKKLTILSLLASIPLSMANASEIKYNLKGKAQGFYGLIDADHKYENRTKSNKAFGYAELKGSAEYDYNSDTTFGIYLNVMKNINRSTRTLNNGSWGKELYGVADSKKFGQLTLGETYNVAYQFHQGPENFLSVTNFLTDPNWRRKENSTRFTTLSSTAINTDGVAPKASYVSPAFANTNIGVSYINDINNRRGLVDNQLSYSNNKGYVTSVYNELDAKYFDVYSSISYAEFHDTDKDMAASLKLKRGNWSLASGYRKTYIDGNRHQIATNFADNYREGYAWDVGLGYEFGPLKSSLTYMNAKAKNTDNEDKIVTFSNKYQLNKYVDIFLGASHVKYQGETIALNQNNQAYILMTGIGVGF